MRCTIATTSCPISIHAPHAGSDPCHDDFFPGYNISIHAPHAGSDGCDNGARVRCRYFNPRSPCGERQYLNIVEDDDDNFNPRSPCGERQRCFFWDGAVVDFNPRSPCGERRRGGNINPYPGKFQSTLPMRGATSWLKPLRLLTSNFNPRSPCGERRFLSVFSGTEPYFNPRSPCGERRPKLVLTW